MVKRDMPGHKRDHSAPDAQTSHPLSDDTNRSSGMSLSMHDGVEVWCDCCSCEAEPYWVEAFARLSREDADAT